MRLTFILLTAAILHVHAKSTAQKVTVKGKDVPLQKIFSAIEKQTEYIFFFDAASIRNAKHVTLHVKDLPVNEVLDMCLKDQPVGYSIMNKTIVISRKNQASHSLAPLNEPTVIDPPGIDIEGIVLAQEGQALAGASVFVKSTSKGVVTDANGRFKLTGIDANATLVISFTGYLSEEYHLANKPALSRSVIVIRLQLSTNKLNDVIVLGYNDKKRSELTSSVQVIDAKKLNDVTSNDVGAMLQGKVAGLQVINSSGVPGSAAEIRLRGISSVNAAQTPLFVVDGIIGGNYDPNDVENITVLKDAGATAIYGSQANGGVIIITTKKARSGEPHYEARITTGFRTPDFGKMKMMNGSQLYRYQKELYRDYIPTDTGNSYKIDLLKFYSERPRSLESSNADWLTTIFKPAIIQNYHVSVAAKSEKIDYYFGATYYNEDGTFMNTNFKRLNLRGNTNYRFNKKINITNNINLSAFTGKSYDYSDIYYAYLNLPWDNPYDSAGHVLYVDGNASFKWWSRDKVNPIHTIKNSNHVYKGFDANYDVVLNIGITKWLNFSSSNRLAAGYNKGSNYYSPDVAGSYHGTGYLDENNVLNYGIVSNNFFKFNFNHNNHNISGLVGAAFEKSRTESQGGTGRGLPPGLSVLNAVSNNIRVTGFNSETAIQSLLSQVNYGYANRYFLTASYRVDGSSNFPKSNRYASFPSVSGAWMISNESFFRSKIISDLKLRASYGITGTQDIGASRYLGLYSLSSQYNSQTAATPLQLPSPNLTWESKYQFNGGVDITLFKRVGVTVDVYRNITKNLLLQVSQPLSIGFEQRWENAGEIENKGIELSLNTVNIRHRYFEWTTDFNINFNSNKIQGLKNPIIRTGPWAISQVYRNGGNLYEFYMPKWAGVNSQTGQPQWEKQTKDAQGNVTKTEMTSDYAQASFQEVGSALPNFKGGITNQLRYKNFSLSVNAYFLSGNKVFSNNLRFVMNDGSEPYLNQIVLPKDYSIWARPGDMATNPSPQNSANSTQTSSRYLKDGSFLSIRNVTLSYALPGKWIQQLRLKGATVAVSADNVYTFTRFLGQDPQTTITPGTYIMPGVSDFKYPNNRQFLFNINLSF